MLHASFSSSRGHSFLLTEHLVQVASARKLSRQKRRKEVESRQEQCARTLEKSQVLRMVSLSICWYSVKRGVFYASTNLSQSGIHEAVKVSCSQGCIC
jgi:hypothetical protein